jgi:hypothetical protein
MAQEAGNPPPSQPASRGGGGNAAGSGALGQTISVTVGTAHTPCKSIVAGTMEINKYKTRGDVNQSLTDANSEAYLSRPWPGVGDRG